MKINLVSLARFEPTAFRLGGERSILLSYRDSAQLIPCKTQIVKKKQAASNFFSETAALCKSHHPQNISHRFNTA